LAPTPSPILFVNIRVVTVNVWPVPHILEQQTYSRQSAGGCHCKCLASAPYSLSWDCVAYYCYVSRPKWVKMGCWPNIYFYFGSNP